MATIQTKTNLWVMTKILVEVLVAHDLATIQTHPNTRLVEDARGAEVRARRDASAEWYSATNCIPRT